MSFAVEHARQQWEEGERRLAEAAESPAASERLWAQVDAVARELRRRIGETFTLAELADLYAGAETWAREAVEEHAPTPGWPRTLSLAVDAAFNTYSRNAVDYAP